MKRKTIHRAAVLCAAAASAMGASLSFGDLIVKANNNTALNDTGSWVGGAVPGSDDIAVWDVNYTSGTLSLGDDLSWYGIQLTDLTLGFNINSGNTLTLGEGGITTNINKNFTWNNAVILSADQTWTISSGTFVPGGGVDTAGNTFTLKGGTIQFKGNITGGGDVVVNGGTVKFSNGTVATASDLIVNAGTLNFDTASGSAASARAANVILNASGSLTISGPTGSNSIDTVSGDLIAGDGSSGIVSISPNSSRNSRLTFGGTFSRAANAGTTLLRGTNLGVNTIASQTANSSNIVLGSATLVGGTGSNGTDQGILVGAIGDTSSSGTGFGATGALVTYDASYGVRQVTSKTSITDGQTQLDNVRLANSSGLGPVTTTLNSDTTVNSLHLDVSGANTALGSGITLAGAGTLTINSGVIFAVQATTGQPTGGNANNAMILDVAGIDLAGREGLIITSTTGVNNGNTAAPLRIQTSIANDGGNGLTIAGTGEVIFSGPSLHTYTGATVLNSGILRLDKNDPGDSTVKNIGLPGDLIMNGGTLLKRSESLADTANLTINAGTFWFDSTTSSGNNGHSETLNNFTMNGGFIGHHGTNAQFVIKGNANVNASQLRMNQGGDLTIEGTLSLNGGQLVSNESNSASSYAATSNLNAVSITQQASGEYTAIIVNAHDTNLGAKVILNGNLSFTGNLANTNTVLIDSSNAALLNQGYIALEGIRQFNIGDGGAAVDLTVNPRFADGSTAGGITKTGAGTLAINGASTHSGGTNVVAGKLVAGGALGTGAVTVGDDAILQLNLWTAINDNAGLTIADGGVVNLNFAADQFEVVGPLTLGGVTYLDGNFNAGNSSYFSGSGNITATPEPASLGLLAIGAMGLLKRRRRD